MRPRCLPSLSHESPNIIPKISTGKAQDFESFGRIGTDWLSRHSGSSRVEFSLARGEMQVAWPNGKASESGSEDSGFDSRRSREGRHGDRHL
ncbi:Uncharacterized protein HZ326_22028 [Fusarium oxysporum f. sp. albedinis]|nr:Uncharacterized protein HZ326_22028 [Fusarium oxysporum f. sp. albedinis]